MGNEKVIAEDYLKFKFVEQVNVSKNYVCWVERKPNPVDRGYNSKVNLLNKSTGKHKAFTAGSKSDMAPSISPDEASLAFLSTRGGKPQLYLIDLHGGEANGITSMKRGVNGFKWSPDGTKIIFNSKIKIDEDWNNKPEFSSKYQKEKFDLEEKEKDEETLEPRVVDEMVYRSGTSFYEPKTYNHLFLYDLITKEITQISDGEYNFSSADWLDENTIVATTVREKPTSTATHATIVKFMISEKSSGTDVIKILSGFLLFLSPPVVSKGKEIAIGGVLGDGRRAGQNHKIAIVEGSSYRTINQELDRSIGVFKWIAPNKALCLVEDSGLGRIYSYDNSTKELKQLFEPPTSITSFDTDDGSDIYFTGTNPKHPWALWKWTEATGVELVNDPNEEFLDTKQIVEPEMFWLTNPEGIKYQGWFFDAGDGTEKPPLILSIHGGPHVMWNDAGTMWHEWQMQLSAGYSILALNPIGSGGYGEAFSQKILGKWGDDDARDLLLAVDHFSDRVDTNRLYTTGGSYAGFQVANIITKDHRFKAACSQRGVYNVLSFWMATDIPIFGTEEWLWDYKEMDFDLQHLWNHSPTANAHKVETPLLIVHSENDFRVQISQAEDFYGALKIHDKEVVLLRYPRDGHELSRSGEPIHLIDRLNRMLKWFNDHP